MVSYWWYSAHSMERLSSLLPTALKKRGLHQVAVASSVVLAAQRWIDSELAATASALHARTVRDAVLSIDADNPIALSEMNRRVPMLLQRLQQQFPDTALRSVHCRRSGGR